MLQTQAEKSRHVKMAHQARNLDSDHVGLRGIYCNVLLKLKKSWVKVVKAFFFLGI